MFEGICCTGCFACFDFPCVKEATFVAFEVFDPFVAEEAVEAFVECCLGDLGDVESKGDED